MADAREDLLAAFEEKPEGRKILTWQEIVAHPRLEQYDPQMINAEVKALEAEGAVRTRHETPSETPYDFDSISAASD